LRLYATTGQFEATARERSNYDNHRVRYEILDHAAIVDLEPDITGHYAKAILLTGAPSVSSPQSVCQAYLGLFTRLGGIFRSANVIHLQSHADAWSVATAAGDIRADHMVVACGAQSMKLLSPLGIRIPLAMERGYHLAYRPAQGKSLSGPIVDMQKGLTMTPMNIDGDKVIRVTSAVNLVAMETAPSYRQILDLVPHLEGMFPFDKQITKEPWMGHRPSMPDSLPVIGPAPGHENLWLAIGHGHIGLTTGPKTGVLIANAITGEINDAEADAFLPARFL
jgi:D-amino-acid dehydrogenase